jgi:hypothetical protein
MVFRTMESIKVRQHIGQDGILHLDIPVGLRERGGGDLSTCEFI